jgi:hypothetical protein
MGQAPAAPRRFDRDGAHRTAAIGRAIPWIDIDMARPQAKRAMIGVAVARDARPAMAADEIFDAALEAFAHSPAR